MPYTSYAQISEAVGPIADLADTYARSVCEVERSLETIKIMEANVTNLLCCSFIDLTTVIDGSD